MCQRYEPDEEEDDDAAAEHDFVLIDVVSDVIGALAKVWGGAVPVWRASRLVGLLLWP